MSAELLRDSRKVTNGLRRVRIQLEGGVRQSAEITETLVSEGKLITSTRSMHTEDLKSALGSSNRYLNRFVLRLCSLRIVHRFNYLSLL